MENEHGPSVHDMMIPMKPMDRESVPGMTDQEYDRLRQLVDQFPQFGNNHEDPRYAEWEVLQKKAEEGNPDSK